MACPLGIARLGSIIGGLGTSRMIKRRKRKKKREKEDRGSEHTVDRLVVGDNSEPKFFFPFIFRSGVVISARAKEQSKASQRVKILEEAAFVLRGSRSIGLGRRRAETDSILPFHRLRACERCVSAVAEKDGEIPM